MAVRRLPQLAYGMGDNLLPMSPLPIVAQRAPATSDFAEIGTFWVDVPNDAVYCLTSITSNSANWTTSPASGVGMFTAVTVNPGDITVTAGDIVVSAGTLTVSVGATSVQDLAVGGTFTMTGDFDLTSAALIDLTSTFNGAPSIYLHANGGTAEQIRIHSDQGTSVNSVELDSDVGGITLVSGLASADAINLSATAGGVDIDGALQVNIASSQNAASALVINASAGGIDITAAGAATEDIDIVNTAGSVNITSGEVIADSMVVTSAGGLDIAVAGTGGLDIDMVNSAGSITITAAEAAGDAIVINASDAGGGVQIQAGSAGILIGNQADCAVIDMGDIVPTSARTVTISGGTVATAIADTLDIGPDGVDTDAGASKVVNINTGTITLGTGTTNIASGNRVSGTHDLNMSTGTGTKTVSVGNADGLTTVNIDAITLINDSINVNTSINTGTSTGTVAIGNAAATAITLDALAFSIDSTTASNITVTGAGQDLTLASSLGSVLIESTEDAALAIRLHANGGTTETIQVHSDLGTAVNSIDILSDVGGITLTATGLASADAINLEATAGGIDADAALQINIDSSQAAVADSIRILASAADGGIDIDAGTGGITIDSTGAVSIDGAAASNFSTSGAGIDLTLSSALGSVVIDSGEAIATAVSLTSSNAAGGIDINAGTGGLTLDSTGAFSIDGVTASNVTVTGASADLTLSAAGGSVNITATEAAADAIVINASDAAGGIDLTTGGGELSISSSGLVTMVPATATAASPTDTVVINANVGVATFTGYTTAAAGAQTFTITNSVVAATSGILVTADNIGANDAQMTVTRVFPGAGTFDVTVTNNGAAALNGNIKINFWVFAP